MGWFHDQKPSTNILIIAILAAILIISALIHLIVRHLMTGPTPRDAPDDADSAATALQGQLRQLFRLHDGGVDQSYIDTLPVFPYGAIVGVKDPFDCAVCLSEFEPDDKLRLLPACSHAFHSACIDAWLLSHSTCPLCRSSLPAPAPLALESGRGSEAGADDDSDSQKSGEVTENTTVVQVKLGKYRNVESCCVLDGGEGSSNLDQRRCYSMGYSYEYVMNEASLLQVAIRPSTTKKPFRFRRPGNYAVSECDWYSMREGFKGFDNAKAKSEFDASDADLDVEVGSCNGSAVSIGSQSFARRTLLWIVGRQNRVGSHV